MSDRPTVIGHTQATHTKKNLGQAPGQTKKNGPASVDNLLTKAGRATTGKG